MDVNTYGWSGGIPKISSIIFPNTVEKIGTLEAPSNHTPVVKNIILSQNLKEICDEMFSGQANLENIIIPSGVINIGNRAFIDYSALKNISVDRENSHYIDIDGVLFDKAKTKIIAYPASKKNTSYDIPNTVTSIENSAFYKCNNLTNITMPNSITNIGDSAFYACNNLTSINIPNSMTNIGNSAFHPCSNLTNINIPDSVISIGEYAFDGEEGVTINCQAIEKPSGWDTHWITSPFGVTKAQINWGVDM